jgi:hypothetical protein
MTKYSYTRMIRKATNIGLINVNEFIIKCNYFDYGELKKLIQDYENASTQQKYNIFTSLEEKIKVKYVKSDAVPIWKHAILLGIIQENTFLEHAVEFKRDCGKEARELLFLTSAGDKKAGALFLDKYLDYCQKINKPKRISLTTKEIIANIVKPVQEKEPTSLRELSLKQREFIESINLKLIGESEECYDLEQLRDLSRRIGLNIFGSSKKDLEDNIMRYIRDIKLYSLAVVWSLTI